MPSSPIRVGFIGLSASPTAWAYEAHIPYLINSPHYKVVALCNSSTQSAQAAIKAHNLPTTTKAYSKPEEVAQDSEIDLVVVSVNVATHYPLAKPALLAGKDVFVEWPLASNLAQAEELVAIARSSGSKIIVGLQERLAPPIRQVKSIVDSGRLGKVLSTNLLVDGLLMGHVPFPARLAYLGDRRTGGNMITINAIHVLDAVVCALGPLQSYTSLLGKLRPTFPVLNDDGTISQVPKDTHDQLMITGRLESAALISFHMRGGPPFKDSPGLRWRIYGEKAELSIGSPSFALMDGGPVTIKLHDFASDNVEVIEAKVAVPGWEDRPGRSQAIGSVYEAFATGKEYPDAEVALKWHKMIEDMYEHNPDSVSTK